MHAFGWRLFPPLAACAFRVGDFPMIPGFFLHPGIHAGNELVAVGGLQFARLPVAQEIQPSAQFGNGVMTIFGFDLDAQPIPPPALIVNRHVLLMDDRLDHAMSHRPPADLSLECCHATGPLSPVTQVLLPYHYRYGSSSRCLGKDGSQSPAASAATPSRHPILLIQNLKSV